MFDLCLEKISKYLMNRDDLLKIVEKIEKMSAGRKISFYPCSRHANYLINFIKDFKPELFKKINFIFDNSKNAKSDTGVVVSDFENIGNKIDDVELVVVASNNFVESLKNQFSAKTGFNRCFIKTSAFDFSLPNKTNQEILSDIRLVYDMLHDEKSKMVYLLTWLSKALNDESITSLFEGEDVIKIDGENTNYKDYTITGLGESCARELYAELYKMKYVFPKKADIIFDIGGYKGDTAAFFAYHVGESGKVFSFEPTKVNYSCLQKNIKDNNLERIVEIHNVGFSDIPATMKATSIDSGAPWSFIDSGKGDEDVKITTIDTFVEENNLDKIDFIKMDVEGFEEKVIRGGCKTLKKFNPSLVIPLYHKTSDLTELPLLLRNLGKYNFYIRCKMEGPWGINLYCESKEND